MRSRYKLRLLPLWIMVFLLPYLGYGQIVQRSLPAAKWQQLTNDSAFSYRNQREVASQQPAAQSKFLIYILTRLFQFFASLYGHLTIGLIAVFILAFVVYKILHSGQFNFRRAKKTEEDTYNEEDITVTNWEQLVHDAAGSNNLKLAVRYNYMWLLQLLEKRALIQYRIDKTNHDYYLELSASKHRQSFRELSRQYEYAWYGDVPVSATDFDNYLITFNTLKKQLS